MIVSSQIGTPQKWQTSMQTSLVICWKPVTSKLGDSYLSANIGLFTRTSGHRDKKLAIMLSLILWLLLELEPRNRGTGVPAISENKFIAYHKHP